MIEELKYLLEILDDGDISGARFYLQRLISEIEEEEVSEEEMDMYCPTPEKYKDLERIYGKI